MAEMLTLRPADLLIDAENPRIEQPNVGQHEALNELARHLGRGLLVLAADIVQHGTDPSTLPIVMESAGEPGRYVVLEGNRRLAALRGLENPDSLADALSSGLLRRLRTLSKQYQKAPIEDMPCIGVKTRDEARHWIELRHTGGNQGAGLLGWGSDEVARFRARGGRPSIRVQALDFLVRRGELTQEARRGRWGTTFERLLRNPGFREQMGLELDNGQLTVLGDEAAAAKALKRVVDDLAAKRIKVTDVYRKEQIEAYAKKHAKVAAKRKSGEGVPAATGGPPVKRTRTKVARVAKKRDKLIPHDCILNIADSRQRDIERELRKLSLENHTNAVSVLFRVFLELSVDAYLDKNPAGLPPRTPLDGKMRAALKDLLAKKKITDQQAKPVRMALQAKSFLAPSVDVMHGYVHNPHIFPAPSDLRAGWDNLQPFVTALWAP